MRHSNLGFMLSRTFHQSLMVALILVWILQGALDAGRKDMLHQYMSMNLSELEDVYVGG